MMNFRRMKSLLSSSFTLTLLITFITLLTVLAVVLGTVTIPGFQHDGQPPTNQASRYAVIKRDFPDPCVIQPANTDQYYAFATRNKDINIQISSTASPGISNWTYHDGIDALPHPGTWAATQLPDSQVWAPSIMQRSNGGFVMYYAALASNHTRQHCIGAATSQTIMGPYTPLDDAIVCDFDKGGTIDPQYFLDPANNASYLVYKADGNSIGAGGTCQNDNGKWPNTPTPIMAIQLDSKDMTTPISAPFEILTNLPTDGPNIESPALWYHEYHVNANPAAGTPAKTIKSYHLAFNAGCYHDSSYRIKHITCIASNPAIQGNDQWTLPGSPRGIRDCTWQRVLSDTGEQSPFAGTLLKSGDTVAKLVAPGGPALLPSGSTSSDSSFDASDNGKQYMIFHADINDHWFGRENVGYDTQVKKGWERRRGMFIAELEYTGTDDMVRVKGLVDLEGWGNIDGSGEGKKELLRRDEDKSGGGRGLKGRSGHRRFH